jgi:hypothetical protein
MGEIVTTYLFHSPEFGPVMSQIIQIRKNRTGFENPFPVIQACDIFDRQLMIGS